MSGWRNSRWYVFIVLPLLGVAFGLVILRGPDWHLVQDAFTVVSWEWVVVAIVLNLLSVVARSLSWDTAVKESMPPPYPSYPLVFSAFCVGLFANAVLPGRVGELARVAVLRRRMPGRSGTDSASRRLRVRASHVRSVPGDRAGRVGAPRGEDPEVGVLLDRGRARASASCSSSSRCCSPGCTRSGAVEGVGRMRLLWARARQGLGVMRRPAAAATAGAFQFAGWTCQLFAVWSAMFAFHIHQPLVAAGLVLVLMNVATIFPLWPGNVGLTQAAIALPLVNYGVDYARGIAFGIGLQLIEASVGIGIGRSSSRAKGCRTPCSSASRRTSRKISRSSPIARSTSRNLTEPSVLALASPASLKGVLSPLDAAASLATGLRSVDGDRGTRGAGRRRRRGNGRSAAGRSRRRAAAGVGLRPLGRPVDGELALLDDGTAVVEAASALGLTLVDAGRPRSTSGASEGLGELIVHVLARGVRSLSSASAGRRRSTGASGCAVSLGDRLRTIVRFARRATSATRCSAHVARPGCSGRRRARTQAPVEELERATRWRCASSLRTVTFAGAGAGGGLGAAFAALGAELVEGAELVLELIGFDALAENAALVVTGEGTVDATTFEGKAPGAVR